MTGHVRLATYNIAHGRGRHARVDLGRTAATLAGLDADVVCLQEVDRHFGPRSDWLDQATELAARLGMQAVYGVALRRPPPYDGAPPREYGNAVLARAAPVAVSVHPLPGPVRAEPRCLLLTAVSGLGVGCVHLHSEDAAARAQQVRAVIAALPAGPTILAGDFNADPGAAELRALAGRLSDVWPVAGRGRAATFPSRRPRRRLDQVYVSAGVRANRAWVADSDASDHRPLVVELAVG